LKRVEKVEGVEGVEGVEELKSYRVTFVLLTEAVRSTEKSVEG